MANTPEYEVVHPFAFIEPEMVYKGSIIRTNMKPGPHLLPRNAEAEAAFDAWIKEFETIKLDPLTGEKMVDKEGKPLMHFPRERYRRREHVPGERHDMELVRPPAPPSQDSAASIAAVQFSKPTEWARPAGEGTSEPTPEPAETVHGGEVALVKAAPAPATKSFKAT